MKIHIISFFFIGVLAIPGSFLHAEEEPACALCKMIREENAKKGPPEFEYYDDYLRSQGIKKDQIQENPEPLEKAKANSDQRNIESP